MEDDGWRIDKPDIAEITQVSLTYLTPEKR
jgi:hypothetical protein